MSRSINHKAHYIYQLPFSPQLAMHQTRPEDLRILILSDSASLKFGGEASLPFLYFKLLRQRNIEAWLYVHERTKSELKKLLKETDFQRIYFVKDNFLHIAFWKLSRLLPRRISYFTLGWMSRLLTQIIQKRKAKNIIKLHKINIVHQPTPVSPREPSFLYDLNAPIVIGPMNGGMHYPASFRSPISRYFTWIAPIILYFSNFINHMFPGKSKASVLVYANTRTKKALPQKIGGEMIELVENGVDFSTWNSNSSDHGLESSQPSNHKLTKFVFVGRLIDWKGIDFLLDSFKQLVETTPAKLEIIGDGSQKEMLQEKASQLFSNQTHSLPSSEPSVEFLGWLSQPECAKRLAGADVFVLPSIFECGGAVVLEAMAMGLPVIAAKWGGPVDYLNEDCGILIEPDSREALIEGFTNSMLHLVQNPPKRKEMGALGYQRVREHFDWNRKLDKVLDIYLKAFEARKSES